jgi:type I restriction enzyme S subunit
MLCVTNMLLHGVEDPSFVRHDRPHELPATWRWVRFGNIVDFSAGRTPSRNDTSFWNTGDFAWISIADMEDGKTVAATKETVSSKARANVFKCEPEAPGTMIMSFKLTIGKIARLGIAAFHNEAIISIRPHLDKLDPFLFKVLPDFARGGDTKGAIKGATLNRASISNISIPLPPLAEQHRIVAKIDELMALCDRLEEARSTRETTRDWLAAASLARLNRPDPDPQTFRAHAAQTLEALAPLTSRPDQIKLLRQTILSLAVRGQLSEPDQRPSEVERAGQYRKLQNGSTSLKGSGHNEPDMARVVECVGLDEPGHSPTRLGGKESDIRQGIGERKDHPGIPLLCQRVAVRRRWL